jgi:hypothetical protein
MRQIFLVLCSLCWELVPWQLQNVRRDVTKRPHSLRQEFWHTAAKHCTFCVRKRPQICTPYLPAVASVQQEIKTNYLLFTAFQNLLVWPTCPLRKISPDISEAFFVPHHIGDCCTKATVAQQYFPTLPLGLSCTNDAITMVGAQGCPGPVIKVGERWQWGKAPGAAMVGGEAPTKQD